MPNILEVEGIGQIKMPDEWSPEQIQEWAQTRLPRVREDLALSRRQEIIPRIGRDLAEAGADVIKGLVRGRQLMRDAAVSREIKQLGVQAAMTAPPEEIPVIQQAASEAAADAQRKLTETREQRLQESPLYQFGEQTVEAAKEVYRVNPKLEETIPSQVIRAGATTIPILAAGAAGPAAPLVGAGLYGAMAGQQGAEEAIEKGHPEKADEAYLAFAGLGAISEAALGYPLALLRSVQAARRAGVKPEQFGRQFRTTLAEAGNRIGREMLEGAGREAAQESTEQAGQNVAARMIGYDPNRPLTKNVWEAFWLGGAVGGLFGSVAGAARAIDELPRNQFGRLVEEEMLRPMEQQRTPGVVGRELVDALTRAQMNPELAQRTFVPAMLAQPQAPPTGVTLSEAPPAPPVVALMPLTEDQSNTLRRLGITDREIQELTAGAISVPALVERKIPMQDRGPDHANAVTEARLQAVADIERALAPAPAPEPPVRRRSPGPSPESPRFVPPGVRPPPEAPVRRSPFAPSPEQPRFVPPGVRPVPVPPPTPEVPSAVPVSPANEVSLQPAPEARPQVVQEIRQPAEEPAGAQAAQTQGQVTQTDISGVQPRPVKSSEIAIRPDLMQFKRMDDSLAGINTADVLEGKWDDLKAGNLLLWEPNNPSAHGLAPGEKYIVANGHHRLQFGRSQNVGVFSAQIIREADGFSAQDARALGAEINISDGKGTIYDQARFIRNEAATHGADAALARARQIGARGRKAATIAIEASDSLFDSFINEQITPDQAEIIARSAPRDEALQRVGVQQAARGKQGAELSNFLQAVKSESGPTATQIDLFGSNDAAIAQADAMAKKASARQRELTEQIAAVQGAAKRPEQAAKLGVNVSDPEGILKRVTELKAERERWENWALHPDLVAQLREAPAPVAAAPTAATIPTLRQGERQGDLMSKQTEEFALVGEKAVDTERLAAEQAAAERARAEAAELQKKQQQDLFGGEQMALNLDQMIEQAELPAQVKAVWKAWMESPVMRNLNWEGLRIEIWSHFRDGKIGSRLGAVIQLAERGARGDVLPHEVSHILYDALPEAEKQALERWRIEGLKSLLISPNPELMAVVGEDRQALLTMLSRGVSSRVFLEQIIPFLEKAGLPHLGHEIYKHSNPGEFYAHFIGDKFAAEHFKNRNTPPTLWTKLRDLFLKAYDGLRRVFRLSPSAEQLFRQTVAGLYQPTLSSDEEQLSLETAFQSPENLERFIEKETISPEVSIQLRDQAGAQAALVPNSIAEEIEGLNPEDAVEKRMASLLNFVTQIHGLSVAIDLKRILNSDLHPEDLKQAAIGGVLRQVQRVETEAKEIDNKLQDSIKTMASLMRGRGRIEKQHLIEERSKQIAQNLVAGYKAYLTAQAATLPADSNVAAARQSLLRRMEGAINEVTRLPDATMRALEAIAERISELPVNEGPQAVIDAIRMKDILRGKVGDSTIEMLTEEKPGGLPPLLFNPALTDLLRSLSDLQKNADRYAKQIEVVEQAFRGKGDPTPVQLRKWAETYRKFRNKQADAAKALAEYDKSFQKADQDIQVYGRSGDVLDRLQASPEYQAQMRLALGRPGGEIRSDLYQDAAARKKEGDLTKETVYVSPLKHIVTDEEGKETEKQNTFRVHLAPHIQADRAAVEQMQLLVEEIERYLAGENGPVDPISERTWSERRDYLKQYVIHPKFLQEDAGSTWANPFRWLRIFFGGLSDSLRGEFGKLGLRAAEEAEREVLTSEFAATGYRNLANNEEIGDAATNVATIAAVKSHGWETGRIKFWNQYVLNPIVAAGQTAGQMRLQKGDYIPGTDIQITPEDIAVARMEKRFSQGIVQTTQGTAKGSPALLRMNPVLIEDRFSGKPVLRGAMSPGPLTMARSFSTWGRGFDLQWHGDQTHVPTPEERRRMVQDGDNFQMAVLGYIRTTNPEFENNSPLLKVYEAFAKNGKDDPSYKVNSMDQLLDKLADIAVEQGLFENKADASPSIEATLMKEIGEHITAIRAQFAEDHPGSETVPQQVMQFASSQNAFTKPRKRMVAPDPYYDYTLTHESDRISFVAAALQQFQSRIITKMEALQNALELQQRALDKEIDELYNRGMGERKARKTVTERTARKLGALRFSYEQLLEHKRRLDKLVDQMKALVIDSRNPNDSPLIAAWTRGQTLLSSGLLANPTAIGNNLAGGILSGKNITLWNLGQGRSFWNPKTHARLVSETIKKLLRAVPGTPIERLARSNMPLVKDMAGWVNDMLLEQIQREADAEAAGLISRADLANRLKARGELMTSAGQIDYESPKGVAAVINAAGSLPGVRYALGQLRDKIPGAFDRFMNTNNSRFYQDSLFLDLKNLAIKAFRTREEIAARTGRSLDEINDFSQEANLLTPKELNRPKASGYRDAGRLRQLFNSIGSLDAFLLDYYTRYKAAPEGEKADVPLFPDPADEGAVIYDLESHENLATSGFTPLAFQGVGQRGLIKKLLFMFKNYPTRLFEQMSRMLATDPRDPKVKRELHNWFGVLTLLIISALAGLLGKEAASPIQQAITGRSPSFVKLSNVLENPDAGMLARYVGMGLASNLPYYGGVISQILGNPGYGTWLDAAEYIPAAGLVKDAGLAVRRTAQTGDPIFPATDFIARWFPPASPALRLIPDVAGDIEGRNAARALRVVGPSAGMELAGGAGATYKQTPATLETRRLLAAAYRGDAEGIKEAFDAAVRERAAAGSADPERAVMQSIAAAVPARRVFGRSITAGEEAQLTSLMSAGGRADYAKSRDAFDLINRTLGTTTSLTSQPRARRTTGGRRRRTLRGGSRLPRIRRVRSRRGRSRRRSPFGFRQPTARRRRRSPTFSTAA